jgi:alkylhydroperoxidase family enzyme
VTLDEAFVKALVEDYENAPLAPADRLMLDYVGLVTEDATRVRPEDHKRLREGGFDDRAILQITLIAAWFNYINKVADALGVGRDR